MIINSISDVQKYYKMNRSGIQALRLMEMLDRTAEIFSDEVMAVIKDKKIIDAGCSDGTLTSLLLDNGASQVRGFDNDEDNVAVANFLFESKGCNFDVADLNDPSTYSELLTNIDIMTMFGITYYITDIKKFIETISNSGINTLIIETMYTSVKQAKKPPELGYGRSKSWAWSIDEIEEALDSVWNVAHEKQFRLNTGETFSHGQRMKDRVILIAQRKND